MRLPRPAPVVLGAAAALALGGAVGLWYLFFRSAGPAPVGGTSPAPAVSAAPGSSVASGGGTGSGDVAGTWAIAAGSDSFVGYRVQEELANIGATTAVGRTSGVAGSIVVEGTTITAVDITADLTGLTSDDQRRDGQLRRQALETNTFPTATFTLSQPVELGSGGLADGGSVSLTATGDLTLHGVTRSVRIPLTATRSGDRVTVTGSIAIVFADYSITPPSAFIVLSVADHGTMELQLVFTRA